MQVFIVGAGPGDPELITVKGQRLLREADVIIYAGSLVNPDVLKVADVDIIAGNITLLGAYGAVRDFIESWNLEADDPRIARFIAILRRETSAEVSNVEFRSGELLYELTVKTLDFTAPEYVYIEGVDFRNRVLYCYTFVEDMNEILETDSYSILGYPFTGTIKS